MNSPRIAKELSRRDFLHTAGAAAASLLASDGLLAAQDSPPINFLFILADDLGWRDLGCYGSSFYETPHLDNLARQGMRFTDAYAACPVCSPTRASIMTGKYPARLDATDWFGAPQPDNVQNHWTKDKPLLPAPYRERLPLEELTLAEAFQQHGYATFFAGKWHLGAEGFYPQDQGFDVNKGGWERGAPVGPGRYFVPYGNPKLTDGPSGEHLPDRLASETCHFIEQHKDKPFLAYLSFYSVHTPLIARGDLRQKYQSKKEASPPVGHIWGQEGERQVRLVQEHAVYAGMVEAMDQAVGKVIDKLDELHLAGNTAIIFMSDNGGLSTSEGHPTSNLPLRAGKGWLYEGGIREPMIVKWPGVTGLGSVCNEPVVSTDFYPTMLDMAGLALKPDQHTDGMSIVPLLKGHQTLNRKAIFWHYPHYGNQGAAPASALRMGDYKLIQFHEDHHLELYDLKTDIAEEHNLALHQPERTQQMLATLARWLKDTDAKMPTPNPNAKT